MTANWTKTPRGWRIVVHGSSADLSGQKIPVARKGRDPKPVRLGQLVAPDEGHGAYYTIGSKEAS